MTTTPQSNKVNSITMLTLLRETHGRCEREGMHSIERARQLFREAVRDCSEHTAPSNPSISFFADWIARKCNVTTKVAGKWQILSLDFWQILHEIAPDDRQAYFKFWELFDEYCQLDQRIISSIRCNRDNTVHENGTLLRFELIQLHPETGVYLRSYKTDGDSMLGERISNFGFFDSPEIAKAFAETTARVAVSGWVH